MVVPTDASKVGLKADQMADHWADLRDYWKVVPKVVPMVEY